MSGNGQGQSGTRTKSGTSQLASTKKYMPDRPAGGVKGSSQMKHRPMSSGGNSKK